MPFEHSPDHFLKEVQRCQLSFHNPLMGVSGLESVGNKGGCNSLSLFSFSSGSLDGLILLGTRASP